MVRFSALYSLEYYTEVKEWNKGYLVVIAKYKHNQEPEEEYIDLVPVLQNLYFDVDEFFKANKRSESSKWLIKGTMENWQWIKECTMKRRYCG